MKKVVLGISGGVDSAVAAILLQKSGYEVIGVTFKFIDKFSDEDARKVCNKLNIEYHLYDYSREFREKVINRFLDDYRRGITPNPCVLCNRKFKINYLYKAMVELGADYIATGHYAKNIDGKIFKSIDKLKDQTYFLSEVRKEQLEKLLLPLDGVTKEEVRRIAKENDLFNANKKDSLDVCFIDSSFKEYIKKNINTKPGDIVDIDTGKVIGKHQGLVNYTIGQRRGINVGGSSDRMFVVDKDIDKNILYIAIGDDNKYLLSYSCLITDVNYLKKEKVEECLAKFRYHQDDVEVKLDWVDDNNIIVKYDGVKRVTPGQVCSLYLNDELIGGGIIKEVYRSTK